MCKEVFSYEAGDVSQVVDGDRRLPRLTKRAIYRLRMARNYAEDTGHNAWEFAVTIAELRRDGLSENELRWLVCRGYVEHATEIIKTTGSQRSFDRQVNLRFCKETAFVLTSAGATFSEEFLKGTVRPDGASGENGEMKSFVGRSQSAASTMLENSLPTSNGRSLPKWDRDRRELRLGGQLVKVLKLPSPMQEAILMAFEEEHWPPRIDDPLPGDPDLLPKRRLHDTIKSLNRNQKNYLIRFIGDGTGEGVRWELNHSAHNDEHSNLHLK
jgi:hypothetical protein